MCCLRENTCCARDNWLLFGRRPFRCPDAPLLAPPCGKLGGAEIWRGPIGVTNWASLEGLARCEPEARLVPSSMVPTGTWRPALNKRVLRVWQLGDSGQAEQRTGAGGPFIPAVTDATDRPLDAGRRETVGIADRRVLGGFNCSSQRRGRGARGVRPHRATPAPAPRAPGWGVATSRHPTIAREKISRVQGL